MNGETEKTKHEWAVSARRDMRISGVKEVDSFDEGSVIMQTLGGEMTVEGKDLRVGILDMEKGIVTLSGRIDGVYYSTEEASEKKGLFGRLFR